MSILKTITPNDQVDIYRESSLVNVDCNIVAQDVVAGSIRVTGQVFTNRLAGTPLGAAQWNGTYLKMDPLLGAHSLFSDWSQSTELLGNLPVNSDYGRWVKQYRYSNMDKSSLALLGKEMCGPTDDFTFYDGMTFEISPMILLNSSDVNLSSAKIGNSFRLQFWLPAVNRVFYTDNTNANFTYGIQNLKVHFEVVPASGYTGPIIFDTYHAETPSIVTGQQTIQANIGNIDVKAVSISFQNQTAAKLSTTNPFAFDNIQPSQVGFQLDDLINGLTSFNLKQPSEIQMNGLSLNRNGYDKLYPDASDLNAQVSLVGVKFPSALDTATHKVSIYVQSAANNANIYNAHVIYAGLREY